MPALGVAWTPHDGRQVIVANRSPADGSRPEDDLYIRRSRRDPREEHLPEAGGITFASVRSRASTSSVKNGFPPDQAWTVATTVVGRAPPR